MIIKYRLSFDELEKPVTTMFVGTMPGFEMALYTACFMMSNDDCRISLGGTPITIRTFAFKDRNGKQMVGSAYPVI